MLLGFDRDPLMSFARLELWTTWATGLKGTGNRDIAALSVSRQSERDKCIGFPQTELQDSAPSKDKLKKREALLLISYNLRNVVNNSLSFLEVLTFYFGSAAESPDSLVSRLRHDLLDQSHEPPFAHQKFSARDEFDVYANVNIL